MTQTEGTQYESLLREMEESQLRADEALKTSAALLAVAERKVAELQERGVAERAELAAVRQALAGLRDAMQSRAAIEQAKGIIIGSVGCDPDEAFRLLAEQSQHENRKLRDVAEDLVRSKHRQD